MDAGRIRDMSMPVADFLAKYLGRKSALLPGYQPIAR
jgi:hypothetical protein